MPSEADSFLGVKSNNQEPALSQRYPALRAIGSVYRILAVLTGIIAVIIIIIGVRQSDADRGIAVGMPLILGGLVGGSVGVISNLAVAEIIRVFLDIEENTRNTYYAVWNGANKL